MRIHKTSSRIALAAALICAALNSWADDPAPSPDATTTQASAAAPPTTPPPASPDQSSGDDKEKGKNCIWTCLQWSKECNVDPRGVYKCNRVCAQFGEQCE